MSLQPNWQNAGPVHLFSFAGGRPQCYVFRLRLSGRTGTGSATTCTPYKLHSQGSPGILVRADKGLRVTLSRRSDRKQQAALEEVCDGEIWKCCSGLKHYEDCFYCSGKSQHHFFFFPPGKIVEIRCPDYSNLQGMWTFDWPVQCLARWHCFLQ